MAPCIYIRRLADGEIVSTIPLEHNPNERALERVVRGLRVNLHPDYYVDASEVEDACRAAREARG